MTQGAISHIEKGDSGISMEGLLKWSEACGTELSLIGPTSEEGLRLLVALDPRRLTLAMRFLRAMPSLDPAHIITLEALIETWIKGPSGRGR
jgi:transcriptional regulator with XRE-family HTH domain